MANVELNSQQMKQLKYRDFCNAEDKFDCGNHEVQCDACDGEKIFGSVGILEVHRTKIHKAEPMSVCDECGSLFKRRMGMILHLRQTHMPPDPKLGKALGCDICDAFLVINGFTTFAELEKHTAIVHGKVSPLSFFWVWLESKISHIKHLLGIIFGKKIYNDV